MVDDASSDGSAALAESWGARVLRHESRRGPAAARNAGARVASCALVFFLDADVAVHPETLARAVARFDADPGLAALFGSYDAEPEAPGLVSGFRNLLHHYVHQQGEFVDDARPARSFWTGCGAIRRQVFLDLGGFDPGLYRRPAIEDIELGYRMTRAGHRVVLARDVLATHLKRWTLGDVLRTDIFRRGVPWMLLIKRSRIAETDLNVGRSQKLSVAATGIGQPGAPGLAALPPAAGDRVRRAGGHGRPEPGFLPIPGESPRLGVRDRLGAPPQPLFQLLRPVGRHRAGALALPTPASGRLRAGRADRRESKGRSCRPGGFPSSLHRKGTEAHAMDQAVTVALVRGDNRRGAVAQVLSLLVAEVARCVSPGVMLLPSLARPGERAASTHSETLSATLDAVLAAGANEVTVASGAPEASAMFEALGYTREAWGRPVAFLDLERGESRWDAAAWTGPDGSRRSARVARTVAAAPCRISLATSSAARILGPAERARQSPSGRPGSAPLPDGKRRRLPRRPGPGGRAAPLPGRCIPGRESRRGASREIEGGRYGDRGPRRGRGRCGRGGRPGVRPS